MVTPQIFKFSIFNIILKILINRYVVFYILIYFVMCNTAFAAEQPGDVMNSVAQKFLVNMNNWSEAFQTAGNYLLVALATISLTWRSMTLLFRTNNINDVLFECIRTIMIVGFFMWVMNNIDAVLTPIVRGFQDLAGLAGGNSDVSASGMITNGTKAVSAIFDTIKDGLFGVELSADTLLKVAVAGAIMVLFVFVAVNLLLVTVSLYFIIYGGVILLALGGSDWTRSSALNYINAILAGGVRYMAMVLMASMTDGVFQSCLDDFTASSGVETWMPLFSLLTAAIVVFLLITKLPDQLAALVSHIGSGTGVSATGFAAATGIAAAAGVMAGAAKQIAKNTAGFAGNAVKTGGLAGIKAADDLGRNLSSTYAAASDQMGLAGQKAHELFGGISALSSGGLNQVKLQHELQRQGYGAGQAKQMAAQADRMVREGGYSKAEAKEAVSGMNSNRNSNGGRNAGISGENSISGTPRSGSADPGMNSDVYSGTGADGNFASAGVDSASAYDAPTYSSDSGNEEKVTGTAQNQGNGQYFSSVPGDSDPFAYKKRTGNTLSEGKNYTNFDDAFSDPVKEDPVTDTNLFNK